MAPVVLAMQAAPDRFRPVVCVTGQHREMLRQVLDTFGIKPEHNLAVMRPNQSLARMTARILQGVDGVIAEDKPDLAMVQGDTTTAFVAALAAFYRHIPVAHVEAGLRTGDLENPFPEETNRVLIDRLAAFCFAPTELNRRNLLAEGVCANRVFVTGNTGIDALLLIRKRVRRCRPADWNGVWGSARPVVENGCRNLVLLTLHRRESFGERMQHMLGALGDLARRHADWEFVYPVHLNPSVREPALALLSGYPNIHLIEPLPYEPFVYLMDRAALILTDSGGIQEEAPSLGKPVVVMRERTERQEALEAETATLAGNTGRGLEAAVERVMRNASPRGSLARSENPYGDGHATDRILGVIWKEMGRR